MIQIKVVLNWISLWCFYLLTQKTFHADIVSVMSKWLKEEELVPEDQRPTAQARAHYVKVSRSPTVTQIFLNIFFWNHTFLFSTHYINRQHLSWPNCFLVWILHFHIKTLSFAVLLPWFAFNFAYILHLSQLMEQVFSWYPVHSLKKWNSFSEDFPR